MAVSTSRSGRKTELQPAKLWREKREMSPDRAVVWTEPNIKTKLKRVPVLYYLCRINGQLEHPHFMEVPLSSPQGLFLRDVIDRLNVLRGQGMASMYSWSCKRSYKNGFVWQDLSENDFICPAHGNEYVLKGSELPENAFLDTGSPSPRQKPPPPPESQRTGSDHLDYPRAAADRRRHNQSCSSIDLEYNVHKAESSGILPAANASTRTDDNRHRRRRPPPEEEENGEEAHRDEIEVSPPPSDSSPETLETLMKADGRRLTLRPESTNADPAAVNSHHHHRHRIQSNKSSILMQLIACGSISCGAGQGLGLIGQHKIRVPSGGGTAESGRGKSLALEEKEYFSGSLVVETKKEEFPTALKRSTSYNADRIPHMELVEKEIESARAKCIPRKPKSQSSTRKEEITDIVSRSIDGCS